MPASKSTAAGRLLLSLIALLLLADGIAQYLAPPFLVEAFAHVGIAPGAGRMLAAITIPCAVLLAIPQTSMIGAILVTGFLGGAISVHFRIGEIGSPPQLLCLLLGAAAVERPVAGGSAAARADADHCARQRQALKIAAVADLPRPETGRSRGVRIAGAWLAMIPHHPRTSAPRSGRCLSKPSR